VRSGKDRDRLKVLHEVEGKYITQRQAAGFQPELSTWSEQELLILGCAAVSVGKRAMEKDASWKSPKARLSHCAWESRKGGGISTFSTAPTAAVSFF
jgi:hypothetical protein